MRKKYTYDCRNNVPREYVLGKNKNEIIKRYAINRTTLEYLIKRDDSIDKVTTMELQKIIELKEKNRRLKKKNRRLKKIIELNKKTEKLKEVIRKKYCKLDKYGI